MLQKKRLLELLEIENEKVVSSLEINGMKNDPNCLIALTNQNIYLKGAFLTNNTNTSIERPTKISLYSINSFEIKHMKKYLLILLGFSAFAMLVSLKLLWLLSMILIGTYSYYSNRYIEIATNTKSHLIKIGNLRIQEIDAFKVSVLTAIHNLPEEGWSENGMGGNKEFKDG